MHKLFSRGQHAFSQIHLIGTGPGLLNYPVGFRRGFHKFSYEIGKDLRLVTPSGSHEYWDFEKKPTLIRTQKDHSVMRASTASSMIGLKQVIMGIHCGMGFSTPPGTHITREMVYKHKITGQGGEHTKKEERLFYFLALTTDERTVLNFRAKHSEESDRIIAYFAANLPEFLQFVDAEEVLMGLTSLADEQIDMVSPKDTSEHEVVAMSMPQSQVAYVAVETTDGEKKVANPFHIDVLKASSEVKALQEELSNIQSHYAYHLGTSFPQGTTLEDATQEVVENTLKMYAQYHQENKTPNPMAMNIGDFVKHFPEYAQMMASCLESNFGESEKVFFDSNATVDDTIKRLETFFDSGTDITFGDILKKYGEMIVKAENPNELTGVRKSDVSLDAGPTM